MVLKMTRNTCQQLTAIYLFYGRTYFSGNTINCSGRQGRYPLKPKARNATCIVSYLEIKTTKPNRIFKDISALSVRDDINLLVGYKHICTLIMAHGPGDVAPWVKCLPYKHEDLSSYPQHPHNEPGKVAQTFYPSTGKTDRRAWSLADQGCSVRSLEPW